MKNYQQTVKQRWVKLDRLKHAFAQKRTAVWHVRVESKQAVLDSKQYQPLSGWGRWL